MIVEHMHHRSQNQHAMCRVVTTNDALSLHGQGYGFACFTALPRWDPGPLLKRHGSALPISVMTKNT